MSTQLSTFETPATQVSKPGATATVMTRNSPPRPGIFSYPRDFKDRAFVYTVVSPRAPGLSIGVNVNPDARCNFDCAYCEVDRSVPPKALKLDVEVMARELMETLNSIRTGEIRTRPNYRTLPEELLTLRHVALSGDGEPTISPEFLPTVETVVHVRARSGLMPFKMVLITNGSGLNSPDVSRGLGHFTSRDEIWIKLDAGTQAYMDRVNVTDIPLDLILSNILLASARRPVVIQSLFPLLNGVEPPAAEIEAYAGRLRELKLAGAQISRVQVYSAVRPSPHSGTEHLPLRSLSRIAQRVRDVTGLQTDVY